MRNNSVLHQEMFIHYQSWQQSGLSQIGFCTFHKFNYWVRKFDSGDTKGNSSSGGFHSVEIKQAVTGCRVEGQYG